MNTQNLLESLMGEYQEMEKIWGDFTRFAVVCNFVDLCCRQENPEEYARSILGLWEERINNELEEEKNFDNRQDWKSIFGESISEESVRRTQQAVESVKRAVLNTVIKTQNNTNP